MGRARLLLLSSLIAVLWLLVPLAYATPPDPTSVPGIWDDADYDDVVILAASSSGVTDWHTQNGLIRQLGVIALVTPGGDGSFSTASPATHTPRSPPANLI